MREGGGFEQLWKNSKFTSRLISVIFDEAHCISIWKSFRPDYKHLGRLRHLLPHTPFFLASATLPDEIRHEIMTTLQIQSNQCSLIQLSNDRPNIHLEVRKIRHKQSAFDDLDFLIPPTTERASGDEIPKFLVFFDDIDECVRAADHLRARLHPDEREKVHWFHAQMSEEFRQEDLAGFQQSALYGLTCTDSFGMVGAHEIWDDTNRLTVCQGIDVRNIRVVVQWRLTCDLNTLWQRFGRAARDPSLDAIAILFVEAKYFDDEKEKKTRAQKRKAEQQLEKQRKKARTNSTVQPSHSGASGGPQFLNTSLGISPGGSMVEGRAEASGVDESQGSSQEQSGARDDAVVARAQARRLADVVALRAEFQAAYASTRSATRGKKKVGQGEEVSPELDAFVNAATRSFKCYRAPIMAYYGNDRLGRLHLAMWVRVMADYLL